MFRFTLGIRGFDDKNIPRVVGLLGAVLLTVNHLNSAEPVSGAQVMSCCVMLGDVCGMSTVHALLEHISNPCVLAALPL